MGTTACRWRRMRVCRVHGVCVVVNDDDATIGISKLLYHQWFQIDDDAFESVIL
jgi:hypothetical protein